MSRFFRWRWLHSILAVAQICGCREPGKVPAARSTTDSDSITFHMSRLEPPAPDALKIFIKNTPRHRLLHADEPVSAGDVIQAVYRTSEKHMAIISVDGNRVVTVHYPERKPYTTRAAESGRFVQLGSAFELDDAPLFEHFFLVTSPIPIDVHALIHWFLSTPYHHLKLIPLPGKARIATDFRLTKR